MADEYRPPCVPCSARYGDDARAMCAIYRTLVAYDDDNHSDYVRVGGYRRAFRLYLAKYDTRHTAYADTLHLLNVDQGRIDNLKERWPGRLDLHWFWMLQSTFPVVRDTPGLSSQLNYLVSSYNETIREWRRQHPGDASISELSDSRSDRSRRRDESISDAQSVRSIPPRRGGPVSDARPARSPLANHDQLMADLEREIARQPVRVDDDDAVSLRSIAPPSVRVDDRPDSDVHDVPPDTFVVKLFESLISVLGVRILSEPAELRYVTTISARYVRERLVPESDVAYALIDIINNGYSLDSLLRTSIGDLAQAVRLYCDARRYQDGRKMQACHQILDALDGRARVHPTWV